MMVATLVCTFYLATISTTTVVLFPALLLIAGFVGEHLVERSKTKIEQDPTVSHREWVSIGFYSLIAICGIFMVGSAINFSAIVPAELTQTDGLVFTSAIAIGEGMFFHGFILDALLSYRYPANLGVFGSPYIAMFLTASIFAVYHLQRYGGNWDLMGYVFAGGFLMAYANYKSRRISPSMIAHWVNNVIAFLGVI